MAKYFRIALFFSIIFWLVACEKEVHLKVAEQKNPSLVLDGFVMQSSDHNTFKIVYSSEVGSSKQEVVTDAKVSVKNVSQGKNFDFSYQGNGNYSCNSKISFNEGNILEYCIVHKDKHIIKKEKIPFSVQVKRIKFENPRDIAGNVYKKKYDLFVEYSTLGIQYLRPQLFFGAIDNKDTVWRPIDLPLFETVEMTDANWGGLYYEDIELPVQGVIRLDVWTVGEEAGAYLKDLGYQSANNLGQNAPRPYFGEGVYGLLYARSQSTFISAY